MLRFSSGANKMQSASTMKSKRWRSTYALTVGVAIRGESTSSVAGDSIRKVGLRDNGDSSITFRAVGTRCNGDTIVVGGIAMPSDDTEADRAVLLGAALLGAASLGAVTPEFLTDDM
jgi:hypothetical protein